jgi:PAS domain S-box-containing protein
VTKPTPTDTYWDRCVKWRRDGGTHQSPMAALKQMPALVVLERFPVPALAVEHTGAILFANRAFGEMVGRAVKAVLAMRFGEIINTQSADESVLSVVRAHGGRVVELRHVDGSIVTVRMSKSALLRGDDPVALAIFQYTTEQLWTAGV